MPVKSQNDIGEIRDELKAYKEQLDLPKEDLKDSHPVCESISYRAGPTIHQRGSECRSCREGEICRVSSTVRFSSQVIQSHRDHVRSTEPGTAPRRSRSWLHAISQTGSG